MSAQEPEKNPPVVEYAKPASRNMGSLLMGIFGGMFGYLGMMVVMYVPCALWLPSNVRGWVLFVLIVFVPLAVMQLVARGLKSRVMALTVWITFGVMALGCGSCMALFTR